MADLTNWRQWQRPRVAALTALAFVLATLHLTVRLDREMVDVWDESIYATSALEMRDSGQWAVTTFHGAVDYFNSKPPLNVWLIVGAFDLFGVGLVPLRLPSALAAWLTILVVCLWSRRVCGPAVAALAALVLATTYPFLYVHAGRSANADAPLTLVVTLVFILVWTARDDGRRAVWLGPLAAAALMLKGPGALGYVAPIVAADVVARVRASRIDRTWLGPAAVGALLGAVPIVAWALARWRVDGWRFLGRLISYDIVSRGTLGIEGHTEPVHYYLLVLLRHHYDWLAVTVLTLVLAPAVAGRAWRWLTADGEAHARLLVAGWMVATVLVPTLVPTRLAWYLTPFYPGAAVLTALAVQQAWQTLRARGRRRRAGAVVALVVIATAVAEGRLAYRSFVMLDLDRSAQGLILAHRDLVRGAQLLAPSCPAPEAFLAAAVGGVCVIAADAATAQRLARPGDLWVDVPEAVVPGFERLGVNRRASLHRVK